MNLVFRTSPRFSALKIKIFRLRVFRFVSFGWERKNYDHLVVRKVFMLNYFLNFLIIPPLPVFRNKTAKIPVLMMTVFSNQRSSWKTPDHY